MTQLIINAFVEKEKPDNYCWKGIDWYICYYKLIS